MTSGFIERLRQLAQDKGLEAEVRRALRQRKAVNQTGAAHHAGALEVVAAKPPPMTIFYHRDLPTLPAPARSRTAPQASDGALALEDAVAGTEVEVPGVGTAFLVETPVCASASGAEMVEALSSAMAAADSGLAARLAASCGRGCFSIGDVVWMDLETTGLSSSPLFLIGTLVWEGGGLVAKQFFARNYAEEGAAVALFARLLEGRRLVVSFNGKSFDLPFVQSRAAANGVACPVCPHHFDLLHESRRAWRHKLPNCRLQTIEQFLFGRTRTDDIPGRDIPDAYHSYVRTSDASQMVRVLQHNLLDLVTLVELMVNLPALST